MVEEIKNSNKLLSIIVRKEFDKLGVSFLTPSDFSQQLAFMHHPTGTRIRAHLHNHVPRQVEYTQEVLFIVSGELRVDFYDDAQTYLESRLLFGGDVILLVAGGHGFEVMQEVKMFEVKLGPYVGEKDKTRFDGISAQSAVIGG